MTLEGFYWTGETWAATYEHVTTGATCTVMVRTLLRAEREDKRMRADGYAPVVLPREGK